MVTIVVLDFLVGILCMATVIVLYFMKHHRLPLPPGPPRIIVWGSLASVILQLFFS